MVTYTIKRWEVENKEDEHKKATDLPKCKAATPTDAGREECWARLGSQIDLFVNNEAISAFKENETIVMWIDGRPMPGVDGVRSATADGKTTLSFYWDERLPSLAQSKESWMRILRHPFSKQNVEVSAGPLAGPPLPSQIQAFPIRRISERGVYVWIAFFILSIVALWLADRQWNILREEGEVDPKAGRRAFSLARTQMTFWTFVIAMSVSGIWLVTWNEDVLNPSVLLLLGIATGTTLGAIVVDGSKKESARNTLLVTPGVQADAIAEANKTLTTPTSENFFLDLISDRDGPSISRVQMLLFTLILMGIFVVETIRTLVMPEFSATMLGLMGISSAGYVALKGPEKKM